MKRILLLLGLLGIAAGPALAVSNYLSPDVPTDLSANTFLPWEIVRNDAAVYSLISTLPAGTAIDGIHRMNGGDWLFSVEAPAELPPGGGVIYQPGDVVRFDGTNFVPYFLAAAAGVPATSNVDALFLDGGDAGALIVSFDVPTNLGAVTYEPADLVRFSGGSWSIYFDASATLPPLPITSNVTGADTRASATVTVLALDIPTTLGAPTYLPGELVSWNGTSYASFFADPGWPLTGRLDAFGFLATPGIVPPTMTLGKSTIITGDLTINWPAVTCSVGAEDYGIYEGALGSWNSHAWIDCLDNGADRTEELTPAAGDTYYLVVPNNPMDEGSYGTDSSGTQRAVGTAVCRTTQELETCP